MSVSVMQQNLEKAVARASLADDRDIAGRVRDEGQRLIFLLNGLVRTCRLYQSDNSALDAMVTETSQMLKRLLDMLGAVHLAAVEDQIFLNELRIRMKKLEQELLDQLLAELARHDIGGFSFHAALDPHDVKKLGRALAAAHDPAQPRAALAARLTGLSGVELAGRYRFRVKGEKLAVRAPVGEIFRRGATVVQDALGRLGAGRLPHPLFVRRAVIDLVDALGDTPSRAAVLPLTQSGLDVGTRHLLGVTSLALGMGRALGLSDAALSDLGVAAMLHDVGYTRTSDRGAHEVAGARLLLRQRGFHEGKIRRLQATLEHHLPAESKPSLFARILRIVDDYDILTTPRAGTPQLPAPTAQASMWAARGTLYDADLLALFVQMMGLYPPGSLLELSDGRWVVVISGGRDAEHFAWPLVRLVRDKEAKPKDGREEMDLFVLREFLKPKRVLNPASVGVDVSAVLDTVQA